MLTTQGGTAFPAAAIGWLGFAEPLETRRREPLAAILADVAAVSTVYRPPATWLAVRGRWQAFLELSAPSVDALGDHLVDGSGDVAALRAAALAELGGPEPDADLRAMMASRVHSALAQLWQPVAAKAFRACVKFFDSAVAVNDELDAAADALVAAARLADPAVDQNVATWAVQRLTLGMCVDPCRGHIRKIATAFITRPDRWQAVQELGARLKAADDPLHEYPELPPPIACVDTNRVVQQWDPLDGELPELWRRIPDGWH